MHSRSAGLAAAVLGAAGFSIKAIFVKAAFRYGVDAETLLALRMLYSLPLFLLMGLAATRSAAAPISAADWRALALLGVLGYYTASYPGFSGAAVHHGGARAGAGHGPNGLPVGVQLVGRRHVTTACWRRRYGSSAGWES